MVLPPQSTFTNNGSLDEFTSVDVILEFRQKQAVEIWYSNKMVDRLSLKGRFAAISEVLRCQAAMNAQSLDPSKERSLSSQSK